MQRLLDTLGTRGPREIHIASLLVKPEKLKVDLNIEYVAMNIPNDVITEDEGFLSALGVNDAAGSSTLCRFENSIPSCSMNGE